MNSHRLTLHSYVKDSCGYHWGNDSEPQWTSPLCVSQILATGNSKFFSESNKRNSLRLGAALPKPASNFTALPAPSANTHYTTAWDTLITSTHTETLWIKAHIITQNKWDATNTCIRSRACCGQWSSSTEMKVKLTSITTSALTRLERRTAQEITYWRKSSLTVTIKLQSNSTQTVNSSVVTSMVKCRQLKVHSSCDSSE